MHRVVSSERPGVGVSRGRGLENRQLAVVHGIGGSHPAQKKNVRSTGKVTRTKKCNS